MCRTRAEGRRGHALSARVRSLALLIATISAVAVGTRTFTGPSATAPVDLVLVRSARATPVVPGRSIDRFTAWTTTPRADGSDDEEREPEAGAPPGAPRDITARIVVAQGAVDSVVIGWRPPNTEGASPIVEYRVYRDGRLLGTTPNGRRLEFRDHDPVLGSRSTYQVAARNEDGESPRSPGKDVDAAAAELPTGTSAPVPTSRPAAPTTLIPESPPARPTTPPPATPPPPDDRPAEALVRTLVSTSLPLPTDVRAALGEMAWSAVLAAGLIGGIELARSIARQIRRRGRERPVGAGSAAPPLPSNRPLRLRLVAILATAVGAGATFRFLDPELAVTSDSSLAAVLGLATAVLVAGTTYEVVHGLALRASETAVGRIVPRPSGLFVGLLLVGLSRALTFSPGMMTPLVYRRSLTTTSDVKVTGRAQAAGTAALLLVGLGAFLARAPLVEGLEPGELAFAPAVLDAALAGLTIAGFVGALLSVVTPGGRDGTDLRSWCPAAWGALGFASAFAAIEVVAQPGGGFADAARDSGVVALAAAIGTAAVVDVLKRWIDRRPLRPATLETPWPAATAIGRREIAIAIGLAVATAIAGLVFVRARAEQREHQPPTSTSSAVVSTTPPAPITTLRGNAEAAPNEHRNLMRPSSHVLRPS